MAKAAAKKAKQIETLEPAKVIKMLSNDTATLKAARFKLGLQIDKAERKRDWTTARKLRAEDGKLYNALWTLQNLKDCVRLGVAGENAKLYVMEKRA